MPSSGQLKPSVLTQAAPCRFFKGAPCPRGTWEAGPEARGARPFPPPPPPPRQSEDVTEDVLTEDVTEEDVIGVSACPLSCCPG